MKTFIRLFILTLLIQANPQGLLLAQWVQTGGPTGGKIMAIIVSGENILAGTNEGGVFRSVDNGNTWSPANSGLKTDSVHCFTINGTNLYAGTDGGGVYLSANNGTNWAEKNSGLVDKRINCLAVKGSRLFAGTEGGLFISYNEGDTWNKVDSELNRINALLVEGDSIYAGTNHGVYASSDDGLTWRDICEHTSLSWSTVLSLEVDDKAIYAGTDLFGIYYSSDGGVTWKQNTDLNRTVRSLVLVGTNLYAGTNSGVYLSTDEGETWNQVNSGLTHEKVYAISSKRIEDSTMLLTGTNGGGVFISTDNANSWKASNSGLVSTFCWPILINDDFIYTATEEGELYKSSDQGYTWTAINTGFNVQQIYSLAANGSNLYAGDQSGNVYHSSDNGSTWEQVKITFYCIRALAVIDNILFAGSDGRGVFRSTDNGVTWETVNSGISDYGIWALAVLDEKLFAGTKEGGVCVSYDRGDTWSSVNNGLGENTWIFSLGTAGTTIYAGTNGRSVLHSNDYGASWHDFGYRLDDSNVIYFASSRSNVFAATMDGVYQYKNDNNGWHLINEGLNALDVRGLAIGDTFIFASTWSGGVWKRPLSELITGIRQAAINANYIELAQNYPNPFSDCTTIEFSLPHPEFVTLKILNILGEEVAVLASDLYFEGIHNLEWNSSGFQEGIYFCRLLVGQVTRTIKIKLLR